MVDKKVVPLVNIMNARAHITRVRVRRRYRII